MKNKQLPPKLSWNCYLYDFNTNKAVIFDVFSHKYFAEDINEVLNLKITHNLSYEDIRERVKRIVHYYFRGRCEYETIISSWPPSKKEGDGQKISVCDQIMINFDRFMQYISSEYNSCFKN